jgi:hypothetical protein
VIQGYRYAIGVAVPFLAGLTGPLSGLKDATEETGFATLASDGEAGEWLAAQGWSNVLAYRRGRAPMAEPLAGGHDYVFIGSRTGPDDYLDTEDPRWAGSLVWVEQSDVLPGAQPRPGELGGDGTPWGLYALGAVAAVATVAVVVSLSGDESPRRNPAKRRRASAESGYTPCKCRDCFNTAISADIRKPEFCSECEAAGCEPGRECEAPGAYGG